MCSCAHVIQHLVDYVVCYTLSEACINWIELDSGITIHSRVYALLSTLNDLDTVVVVVCGALWVCRSLVDEAPTFSRCASSDAAVLCGWSRGPASLLGLSQLNVSTASSAQLCVQSIDAC